MRDMSGGVEGRIYQEFTKSVGNENRSTERASYYLQQHQNTMHAIAKTAISKEFVRLSASASSTGAQSSLGLACPSTKKEELAWRHLRQPTVGLDHQAKEHH